MRASTLFSVIALIAFDRAAAAQTRSLIDLLSVGQFVEIGGSESAYSLTLVPKRVVDSRIETYTVSRFADELPLELEFNMRIVNNYDYRADRDGRRDQMHGCFEIVEIGRDFVAFRHRNAMMYVAQSRIRSITIESTTKAEADANARVAQVHVNALGKMLKLYSEDMGQFPSQEQGFQALVKAPENVEPPARWRGPYYAIAPPPADPWGQPYRFTVSEDGKKVDVRSSGPDQLPETGDDVRESKPLRLPFPPFRPFGRGETRPTGE